MSHITRAQHTPSAAATVQVSHALQQFASHAYCVAAGPVSKMALQQEKAFCVLHRVWDEFDYRVDVCRVTQGAHIEGL
jgi:hypothetical protein